MLSSKTPVKYTPVAATATKEHLHSPPEQPPRSTCRLNLLLACTAFILTVFLFHHFDLPPLNVLTGTQQSVPNHTGSFAPLPHIASITKKPTTAAPSLAPPSHPSANPLATSAPSGHATGTGRPSPRPSTLRPTVGKVDLSQFVSIMGREQKISERVKRMALLDQVKATHCSGYHSSSGSTKWKKVKDVYYLTHYDNNIKMRLHQFTAHPFTTFRRKVCHAPHPTRPGVTISIERAGPLVTHGDYDWTQIFLQDVGHLSDMTKGKVVYVVGGMFAPVDINGTILGYPPLHIHHAHLFPYGTRDELREKIRHGPEDPSPDQHDVLIQSHGDSECARAEGGVACMLTELDEGLGFRIEESRTGFLADFTVNDVRKKVPGLRPLEYYVEHVVYHTEKPMKPVTYLSINAPVIPWSGPATYMIPVDESSTLMYYHFPNSFWGSSGTLRDFVFHTHQTFLDSMWLFKGEAAYDVLEKFRRGRFLPLILECNGHDLNRTKKMLFQKLTAVSQAVCVIARPNLQYTCASEDQCGRYDKRMDYRCVDTSIPFAEGEVLTLVAFNKMHRIQGMSRSQSRQTWKDHTNPYTKYFAAYQHSVFRAVFVPDNNASISYVPPAYFYYGQVPKDAFPGPHPYRALKKLQRGCPPSISFY